MARIGVNGLITRRVFAQSPLSCAGGDREGLPGAAPLGAQANKARKFITFPQTKLLGGVEIEVLGSKPAAGCN